MGPPPEGAYYIFAGYRGVPALAGLGPRDAAMRMTAEFKVACVPGDNFYLGERAKRHPELGGRYLRFTFVRSLDVLRDAAAKLEALAPRRSPRAPPDLGTLMGTRQDGRSGARSGRDMTHVNRHKAPRPGS